ncbi:zinc finger, CCHC-type containing protein [Tanacetum coccineum]
MGKTVGELHAMLIEYEKGLPKKAETPQVMMIKGGKIQKSNKKSLKAKGKGKANGKGKDKQVYIPKPKNPKPSAKEHPAKDDTCHHCKEVGHYKRNCPAYLAELIKKKKQVGTASSSDVFIIELFSFHMNILGMLILFIMLALKETKHNLALLIYGTVVLPDLMERAMDLEEIQDKDTSPSEITSKFYGAERFWDLNEPTSYKAAMLDSESNKWIDAMNAEIQSMMDNMRWVLI